MTIHHSLYEINTRVWLRRFDTQIRKATLDDVPESYWQNLAASGITHVWLMGIWKTCDSTIAKYCLQEGATKDSFRRALSDYQDKDVIGSPYSVDRYEINPLIGTEQSLANTRTVLNQLGMKLILDFVPNHFSADSSLIQTHPYVFLEADPDFLRRDPITFYKPLPNRSKVFAHGKDPFFPAWEDTIQVNYVKPKARKFMIHTLKTLAKRCDGVRCDVAMLMLNDSFEQTWRHVLGNYEKPAEEFWKQAIAAIRKEYPEFVFIGEVYWNKEWELQQLGFDYTYDKKLTDRLKTGNAKDIRDHLLADENFQKKSVRFIENHDEDRAVTAFGVKKSQAAAVIISTLPGMRFYYDGQFDGKSVRLPVQLSREPVEPKNQEIFDFYEKLLLITRHDIFRKGQWRLLETLPAYDKDTTFPNILVWLWTYQSEKRLVAVNYADTISTCRIRLDVSRDKKEFALTDMLNDQSYVRLVEEVCGTGLYIELKSYKSHIFAYQSH
jgi:glycosidase